MPTSPRRDRKRRSVIPCVETFERRLLFSAVAQVRLAPELPCRPPQIPILIKPIKSSTPVAKPIAVVADVSPDNSPGTDWLTPAEVDGAYGVSSIKFGNITGDGAGETIAIVDAYDDPNAASDLHQFDLEYNLPDPSFQRLNESGVAGSYPGADNTGGWEVEESLDIEWVHSIAPMANIDLVEATNNSFSNLFASINTARNLPGVVAVSMSFGGGEFSAETLEDSVYFTTPAGHPGVTFVASTGDDAAPGGYPAFSPDVLAVGGTSLTLNSMGGYGSEGGWNDSGGGISAYENQPAYQNGVVTQSTTQRTIPDVSADADPNTGVAVYDSYLQSNPWLQIGGTSVAAPIWSGLMAIVDEGRRLADLNSLDGATQTLPAIYALPQSDFNDITTGNNGYAAGPGYDLVTGRGSPRANLLVPALANVGAISGTVYQDNNSNAVIDAGEPLLAGTTVYIDSNNDGIFQSPVTNTYNATGLPQNIPDNNSNGLSSTITVSGDNAPVMDVSLTLNITHPRDSNLTAQLIGPDGTTITLFSKIGGSNPNFTNTTFSNSGTSYISSSSNSAPYTGTYLPSPGQLWQLNNKSANGTWTLKVIDSVSGNTGSLQSWSLTLVTGEQSATTDSNGNYVFNAEPIGSYTVRQVAPANEVQTSPAAAITVPVTITGAGGNNFGDFPTLITDSSNAANYYLTLNSGGTNLQIYNANTPTGTPAYQVPIGDLRSLAFNLLGSGDTIYVDYSHGNPAPFPGNLSLDGALNSNDELAIIGQSPSQTFAMTDSQIGPTSQSAVLFNNFGTVSVNNCTVNYTGTFSTFDTLDVGVTATFNWI